MAVLDRLPRRLLRATVGSLLCAAVVLCAPPASRGQGLEYEVKAAFLYNFAQFTTWPPAAFTAADEPFRVCVVGSDPFGVRLDNTVRGESVGTHPMQVERLDGAAGGGCHVLFVARDAVGRLPALAKGHAYALLVGETDDFLLRGGVINFVLEAGRVRFDVNTERAAQRGLKFSSRLLRIARAASDPRSQQ